MATEHSNKPPAHDAPVTPVDRGAGYEKRDANIKSLLQFGFWMAVVIAAALIGMRFMFGYFAREMPLGPNPAPFATTRELPPSPRLQVHPHQELRDYCAAQNAAVNSYGWVSQSAGTVRIPVDRAMDLILQRGLPVRPQSEVPTGPAAPAINPPVVSGEEDVKGQCGYVLEPVSGDEAPAEPTGEGQTPGGSK